MRKLLLLGAFAALALSLAAQPAFPQGAGMRPQGGGAGPQMPAGMSRFFGSRVDTVKVWPNGAPNAFPAQKSSDGKEYSEAVLEIYPARNPNGLCVLICPGGGYAMLSLTHEARDFHTWFNNRGISFCVLQYRLPRGHHDVPLSDVQEAMRIIRSRTDLGVTKLGIMGTSAGGHLAATASTLYTDAVTRPDFQILVYPVTTMDLSYTHKGSYDGLLGQNPSQELVDRYSCDKHVTSDTPPAFIIAASDDFLVPVKNSLAYYQALVDNHVNATLHMYPSGGHGFGWGENFRYKDEFGAELDAWLNSVVYNLK
ncbi:MAG: alpha/beta hydrolase [Bacteroidales bacterium]|nr:alpha/beta hydrolase [Bacteroidales bacterium]MBQ2104279.1 alpha/beta hydrolase [Bacteroidales bacterium]MBQ2501554.1 alpha/beta hydrolase [Bacteroidales bacterium]